MMGLGQLLWFLFSFIVILSFAYVAMYFISNSYSKLVKSKNIQVIESLSLGIDKALHLIKVGNKIFLISSTKQNISMLHEVDSEEIVLEKQTFSQQHPAFKDMLDKIIKQKRGKLDD